MDQRHCDDRKAGKIAFNKSQQKQQILPSHLRYCGGAELHFRDGVIGRGLDFDVFHGIGVGTRRRRRWRRRRCRAEDAAAGLGGAETRRAEHDDDDEIEFVYGRL